MVFSGISKKEKEKKYIHQNQSASFVACLILHSKRSCKIISFYIKMVNLGNILRKYQIKIYTKTHRFSKFS